ncbi:hypothetical protein NUW54_g3003 [Trametes sanguinea]|uniref:Uncharacterized protein n=2 Tax=Trametes sanguinea TaxID=158606 RepID=A0ACC1Q0E7_9APHY|nr:hypothetical protein NUW54_g3952 [Trametes sanguinea]KAJ3008838.1 hypothetical protein NUW54_g3003 [Trametes sanguinea]
MANRDLERERELQSAIPGGLSPVHRSFIAAIHGVGNTQLRLLIPIQSPDNSPFHSGAYASQPPILETTKWLERTHGAEPSKAVIILKPGFADRIRRYDEMHAHFAQHGFTVFAYDMRGFGGTMARPVASLN